MDGIFFPPLLSAGLTYTPATVTGGAASGTVAGSLLTTLTGTVSYSVLSGALAVNASTGVLTTSATAPSSGSIAARVIADNGTDIVGKAISVPVQAAAAPTYLPALTTSGASYHAVYSNERLLTSYTGALSRGIRNSDSTAVDLGAGETGVQPSEIATLRGSGQDVRMDRWYDQSGATRDLAQNTAGLRPATHESGTIGGKVAMLFDGTRTGDPRGVSYKVMGVAHAIDRSNFTIFLVLDPMASSQGQDYLEYYTNSTTLDWLFYEAESTGLSFSAAGADSLGKYAPTVPQVVALRSSASGRTAIVDGQTFSQSAMASKALTNFALGGTIRSGQNSYVTQARYAACVVIQGALSDSDVAAVSAALTARFAINTTFDAIVVDSGTSRVAGANNASDTFNRAWYERPKYSKRIKTFNMGVDARPLSTVYANRTTREGAVYAQNSALGLPFVFVVEDAINDLGGLGASSDPATIYANTVTPMVSYLKGLGSGVKVVVGTTPPQDTTSTYTPASATIDAGRTSLNSMFTGNAAAADAIADLASDATMGPYPTAPDNATLYGDKLHPTSAGYSLLSSYVPAAINGLLP